MIESIEAISHVMWMGVPRWRVYATDSNHHLYTFCMYSPISPTLEQINRWWQENSGSAIDLTDEGAHEHQRLV